MEQKKISVLWLALLAAAPAWAAGQPADGTSTSAPGEAASEGRRGLRYQARLSYITSRTAGHDYRSFRSSATDDTGSVNEGSSLPNLNYMSARLGVSPWERHTFSGGVLQSLDSASSRTVSGPRGSDRTLPSSIFSLRYSYRLNRQFTFGAGQTYVANRKFSDPSLSLNYRGRTAEEQGWAPRAGIGLTIPSTERSHNDQLITRATLRSGLSYAAGPWTTSVSLSHSRPIFAHPGKLGASQWDAPPAQPGGEAPAPRRSHRRSNNATPGGSNGDAASAALADPNATTLEAVDIAMSERESDRTTSSIGISFQAAPHLRIGSGAGVTYLETWKQKTIWLTNVRAVSAAYSFWKMEAGSDVQLYSDIHKYAHPSLPNLIAIGFHLTYFVGAERSERL